MINISIYYKFDVKNLMLRNTQSVSEKMLDGTIRELMLAISRKTLNA